MTDAILTINAGSSSIKFALFERGEPLRPQARLRGEIDGIGAQPRLKAQDAGGAVPAELTFVELAGLPADTQHHRTLDFLVQWLREHDSGRPVAAVGHRVVHGADRYAAPVALAPADVEALAGFVPLAPLHQPHNVAGIRALTRLLPGVPQVACFDTAFHMTQPALARRFALPRRLSEAGIKRYGFHGLSYEYIARVLPQHLGAKADGRVVVAHLGNGASMCAMQERKSVATTMGFTALDGLMMGTRCGAIDPGVLLHLMEFRQLDAAGLNRLLYKESGLLGVSGISQDMRALLASPAAEAAEAVELFCYRIARELGSLAAALGGLDALVFTAGIGEHAAPVREQVCRRAEWLGVRLDDAANARHATRISAPDSPVDVLVLPTNEEWMIAQHAAALVQ
ncbi:MAG: acetate kinase [Rhodocyclaceae bacterium]|uniref:Acetate kinase n=1 Tax=Candidatus Desulfobacillus denitrificans TaxID=2608985 RepID=A0A809S478_9PROT|nr:acetate/propionate family kinase [Rhodocyclaceae bacterium]BBO20461.1 acetate kinase [Candidatus Desulfobacillus denitrificans]GIK44466.1 MAG: acetate kinase [Betaproteobacteria bacterium]GJQ54710.1 MAG: acetate kinase [Rhodocyclaceae bacterium]